jgi:phosphate transport system protein
MSVHLIREIEILKKKIIELSTLVEENVQRAVHAVETHDSALAREAIDRDNDIDRMEIRVEEECLKTLALNQPVASDLRFIAAVLKMNNDLERIGDLAVNIGESALDLAGRPQIDVPFDLPGMMEKARTMLKKSLDALVNLDAALARNVIPLDDDIDAIHRGMYVIVAQQVHSNPENAETILRYLSISRALERIADHATNIAEDVIYMIEGAIIRHGKGEINA